MLFNCGKILPYKNQILATFTVNIISLAHGAALGWLSPMLLVLKSSDSPLSSGQISIDEASWLGAIFSVGGVIGNFLLGYIANNFGRKKALCFLAFPQTAFWLFVIFGNHINFLYAARILAGIAGGGSYVTLPIFVTEISSKMIRGSLGSCLVLAVNIGTLIGFIIGAHFPYHIVPYIFVVLPGIYFISILSFPETPQYLLMNGREMESKNSLAFYRNINDNKNENTSKFDLAFDELKDHLTETMKRDKITFGDFNNSEARKALLISLCIVTVNILSGCFVIINYAASIFEETGSNMAPNTSAIIIGVSQIVGTYLSITVADRLPRKKLLSITTGISSLGFFVTAFFALFLKYFDGLKLINWLPIVSLPFTICLLSAGIIPFTFVVMAEILPQKIKPLSFAICNGFLNLLSFSLLKVFPILMVKFGLFVVMSICGVVCILGTIFFIVCLPETRDKYV